MKELSRSWDRTSEWALLKEQGRFNQDCAIVTSTPLSVQAAIGKDLAAVFENRLLLPTIAETIKYQGEEYCKVAITGYLNKLSNALAVSKYTLNDDETMADLVEMIIEKCASWKLVEIRNVVQMAIKGEFGKIYDRVDSSVVFEWINAYQNMRWAKIDDERRKEQSQYNAPIHPEVAGKLAEIFKKVAKPEPESLITRKYGSAQEFMNDPSNAHMIEFWKGEYDERTKAGIPTRLTKDDYLIFKINQAINP